MYEIKDDAELKEILFKRDVLCMLHINNGNLSDLKGFVSEVEHDQLLQAAEKIQHAKDIIEGVKFNYQLPAPAKEINKAIVLYKAAESLELMLGLNSDADLTNFNGKLD